MNRKFEAMNLGNGDEEYAIMCDNVTKKQKIDHVINLEDGEIPSVESNNFLDTCTVVDEKLSDNTNLNHNGTWFVENKHVMLDTANNDDKSVINNTTTTNNNNNNDYWVADICHSDLHSSSNRRESRSDEQVLSILTGRRRDQSQRKYHKCWYHRTFGDKATRCRLPCAYITGR